MKDEVVRMSVVCPYCSARNDDDAEICKVCKQRIEEEIDFNEPIRQLSQITAKIMKKESPHTREFLDEAYKKIMESVQLIMDRTMIRLQDNLKELKKVQEMTRPDLADEDFESFRRFMQDFEAAQSQINAGLHIARESFFKAKNFDELMKGHLDLSAATTIIQDGLSKLQSLTFQSSDPELMTLTPVEIPEEVRQAIEFVDSALTSLNDFTESGEKKYLVLAADKLGEARELLLKVIEEYEEEVLEEEEEMPEEFAEEEIKEEKTKPVTPLTEVQKEAEKVAVGVGDISPSRSPADLGEYQEDQSDEELEELDEEYVGEELEEEEEEVPEATLPQEEVNLEAEEDLNSMQKKLASLRKEFKN